MSATLTLSQPGNGALLVPVPKPRQHRYWAGAEAISNGAADASDSARGIAAKWQAGLTALLGLAVVGTALSRDTILGLSVKSQWTVGIAAAFALVANGPALFHTSLAAAGLPKVNRRTVTRDVVDWGIAPLRQATVRAASGTTSACGTVSATNTGLHFKPSAAGRREHDYPLDSVVGIGPC